MIPRLLVATLLVSLTIVNTVRGEKAIAPEEASPPAENSLIERYRQTLEIDPDNLPLRYQLGVALLVDGRDREAIAEFSLVYPFMSDSAEMNYNLGLAYAQSNDPDSALLYFEQAEALGAMQNPELYPLANAYFNIGIGYLDAGNDTEAARLFSRVLAMEPQRTDIHRILGDLFARSGDIDRALEEFSRFLQVYPDDRTTREYVFALYYNRGLSLLDEKRITEAEEVFSRALVLAPGNSAVLYYLGYFDYIGGRTEMAAERLLGARTEADPEIRSSIDALLYNCALALVEQRKLRQALNAVTPLAQGDAAAAKELVLAGNIHFALKDFAAALGYYRRALAIDPGNRSALQNCLAAETGAISELLARGEALLQAEDFGATIKTLEQALAISPSDPRLRTLLQEAQAKRGGKAAAYFADARAALGGNQPLPALSLVRQGLMLVGADAEGKILEGQILAALALELARNLEGAGDLLARGELPAARESFARVLELDPTNRTAQEGLRAAARQLQQSVEAAVRRGNQALAEENLEVARDAFDEALRLQPDGAEGAEGRRRIEVLIASRAAEEVQMGRRAFAAGRLDEAREHYQSALRYRDDPAVRADLARIEQASAEQWTALLKAARSARADGDFKRARALYGQILARQSAQSTARQELADLEKEVAAAVANELAGAARDLEGKKFSAAIAGFRRALAIEPANREAQRGLTESRHRLQGELARLIADGQDAFGKGDLLQAERSLKAALVLDPYQSEAKTALRRLEDLRRSGNRPGNEEQLYLQGIEFYTRGKYEEAVAVWERVLLQAPGHEKARMNIDKARRKVRQIREFRDG